MAAAVALPLALMACQPQTPSDEMAGDDAMMMQQATAAIDGVRSAYEQALNSGDQAGLAALYAPDAMSIAPDGSATTGAQAIAETIFGDPSVSYSDLSIMPDGGPTVVGDVAYETGTYTQTMTPEGGQAMPVSGRYLVVLRRQADGSWKLVRGADVAQAPMGDMDSGMSPGGP
jgi:uncharacterized protein (TIGR02246 family)